MKEIKVFYNNLYKSKDESLSSVDLDVTLNSYNIPKLNKIEAESLEGEITYEEATETLKNMKNDKSPGSDGYTAEFFKFFWRDLDHFVVRSFNYGLKYKKTLNHSTTRGYHHST